MLICLNQIIVIYIEQNHIHIYSLYSERPPLYLDFRFPDGHTLQQMTEEQKSHFTEFKILSSHISY